MDISIRPVKASDAPFLSKICLLTGNAGGSAEGLHNYGELPGLVYAEPYVNLPTTFGFVMEVNETKDVVGYILGCTDTRLFERAAEEQWWPPLRQKYTVEVPGRLDETAEDQRYLKLLQKMHTAPEACVKFSPAHLHIDILAEYQRQGWGRKLMDRAVRYLQEQGLDAVWLGLDPRNDNAKKFYTRLGFGDVPGAPEGNMALRFVDWKSS
ncbi:acyl-CoA N-acyltransferase [Neolentinus lepideus HHB14362 ss-1]|uniref:Acyl-CoA N-acyltransferase n=1 Tax=Neolentinus lepideus HHB14362 ss-1 TaxID=1314782 RepID=A0A165TLS2_9AGAM|nr:acyl-CoA N-acyltransferase [Neolentinus lepideus HHB14362 ss-1]